LNSTEENKKYPSSYSDLDLDPDIDSDKDINSDPPSGSFSESGFKCIPEEGQKAREDATTVFNRARALWNELQVPPECRDLIIPCNQRDILRTIQNYSWVEIENAIRNYHYHRTRCDNDWKPPPPYGSLYGFLKTGVERYHNDEAVKQQFMQEEDRNGAGKRKR